MNKYNLKNMPSYTIEIEENALNFFCEYALSAFVSIVGCFWVAAIIIYIELQSLFPIYWVVTLTIIEFISLCFRRQLPGTKLSRPRKLQLAALLNVFDGLIVGTCIIFMPYVDDIIRTLLIFSMITICIGATITTLGYQLFFICYTTPVAISFLSSSILSTTLWGGSNSLYAVFIISFAIYIFINIVSRDIYRNYQSSFSINLKNKDMNRELQIAINKAEQANQSKTRFFSAASHDLRQPINTISLFITALSLKKLGPDEDQIITHMTSAVKTIDTQLNSLLEMSKLDSGIIVPKNLNTDIVPILRDMISIYNDQYDSDVLSFDFNHTAATAVVITDQILFERIIQNIVGNSIKYTASGLISINLEKIDDNNLSITISDTGIGISKQNLLQIYDEFYQVGNQERDEKNGFGLGLSIVKRLCKLIDMDIQIKSELGQGTSVQLKIPYLQSLT